MGKLNDMVNDFDDSAVKEYAKEVKITPGSSNVLRFLDGQDSFQKYYISWILCDDEKIRPFIVENEFEGRSILSRMFGDRNSYYRGGYLESLKGQFGKVSTYQAKDPELFKQMTEYWNPSYNGPGTSRPKMEVLFNVIYRNPETIDNDTIVWCEKNKHTKIIRLGQKALAALQGVVDNDGDVNGFDINYTKQGSGTSTVHLMQKAGVNVAHVVAGALKDEEKVFTRYDYLEIIKLSSAFYCLKHIPIKLKRMDAVMGTNFLAEFEKQAATEQDLWNSKKEVASTNLPNSPTPTPQQSIPVAPAELFNDANVPLNTTATGRRVAVSTEEENCIFCEQPIPRGSEVCPKCNQKLLEPCSVCNNLISVKAEICPFCQAKYKVG